MTNFRTISGLMRQQGASRVFFKALANNDNFKQQIYLGGDFDIIKAIPSGDVYADGISKKGPIFKAPLDFFWIDNHGTTEKAPWSQLILYPKYPEIRLSGFLRGTDKNLDITPRHLMQPPTKEERAERINIHRYLVLGVNKSTIWAYCSSWSDELAKELSALVESGKSKPFASVFHELPEKTEKTSEERLLERLKEIYSVGSIDSCRLTSDGTKIPYKARNGAGYTLEAQFGITPNGFSDPDFMDWELKSHSGSVVTLMTPEPNVGMYIEDGLETFMKQYATSKKAERMDFASRHNVNQENNKTFLTMKMEGYDPVKGKITDPDGGLMLRDRNGNLTAGWSFNKVIDHWKRKHSNTCYVSYNAVKDGALPKYQYGPDVTLGQGTSFDHFLKCLYTSTVYYDPGINLKWQFSKKKDEFYWKPKKRNQFRVKWKDVGDLYDTLRKVDLSDL